MFTLLLPEIQNIVHHDLQNTYGYFVTTGGNSSSEGALMTAAKEMAVTLGCLSGEDTMWLGGGRGRGGGVYITPAECSWGGIFCGSKGIYTVASRIPIDCPH